MASSLALLLAGCGDAPGALHCDDLLPAAEVHFDAVAALVTGTGPKGCALCHHSATPLAGFNLEGSGVAYDALVNRMDLIYPQLATGAMPRAGERWSEDDLRLLRTWYCNGGFP